jgi:hypothetical protein
LTSPAKPGELRWFTAGPDGEDIEVDGRGPHLIRGEQVLARSRIYLPARLSDNPDLPEAGMRRCSPACQKSCAAPIATAISGAD